MNRQHVLPRMRFALFTALFTVLTGCGLIIVQETDHMSRLLFADDFRDDVIGQPPSGWTAEGDGTVTVVEDTGVTSGKAVQLIGSTKTGETRIKTRLSNDPQLDDVTTVAIEHDFKIVKPGTGVNLYIHNPGNNVTWSIRNYELRINSGGSTKTVTALDPEIEWHRVRLIANREKNEIYIFLDDVDTPFGPYNFRNPLATWRNAELQVQHSTNEDPPIVRYSNFKVWVVDDTVIKELWGND